MAEGGKRRTRLQKAWGNLVIRTAVYYAVLLGGGLALWRWFPTRMGRLTGGLSGDLPPTGGLSGREALQDAITQPMFGAQWSADATSATVAMIVAALFALPVAWIYILTRQKKGFRQSLVHSLIMLAVVVAGVVVLVKNSLALAFSLAGIVAAVRFRNTLEDSKDAVYIFVATGIGLAAGVDLPVAIVLSIIFNVVVVALWYTDLGRSSAVFEGAIAQRRLEQVRAHADRPSSFVQQLDEELLKAMSGEQLDALAERAARRRKRNAPKGAEPTVFESVLRVRVADVDVGMQAVESQLGQDVKRWQFGGVVHESDGTHILEYAIQLKKSTTPAAFIAALQVRGATVIMDAEIQ
ncbi:MAG: DUF4956 domain-containing protein [Gemmatimonadota bacterium]|nr:DUF4956 domain-containing protein [Gemmatimonadota bacterium]MDH4350656.1 DUF4956 domain-containing protein [Gemmatimonadota bacterium]MDH5196737.1 DUF4956 domain-containing protein [Gemmatimonadota bacterium]